MCTLQQHILCGMFQYTISHTACAAVQKAPCYIIPPCLQYRHCIFVLSHTCNYSTSSSSVENGDRYRYPRFCSMLKNSSVSCSTFAIAASRVASEDRGRPPPISAEPAVCRVDPGAVADTGNAAVAPTSWLQAIQYKKRVQQSSIIRKDRKQQRNRYSYAAQYSYWDCNTPVILVVTRNNYYSHL